MKQYNYNISGIESLNDLLQLEEITSFSDCQSQLIQIYSAKNDSEWYHSLGNAIRKVFPLAIIMGASSVGEIIEGKIITNSTVILFSFFESTSLNMFSYECKPGSEEIIAETLIKEIASLDLDVKGMLLLSTPISNDAGKFFNKITSNDLNYVVFGGGAGDYANMRNTLVFDGTHCFKQGVISVVFMGNDLCIEALTYLGWHPLSKEMTITEIGEMSIKTIDGNPAFSVYEKYLGIKADENFFQNCLEFPLLLNRNGQTIARTPFFVNEKDGSIQLVADMQVGEKFRIGYGNPQMIIAESINIQQKMQDFHPDAIFLYTCICRRFLMQDDVDLETLPFDRIATTAGFYTFGEFFADSNSKALLNSTMVAVGFREGHKDEVTKHEEPIKKEVVKSNSDSDPYRNQHTRILSRLLYFINVMTKELEERNQLLKTLDEQKNEFLGIAAHDLRNPIGIIQGFSQILNDLVSDGHQKFTGIIIKESTSMLNLIDDLLDISKIEAGKLDLKIIEVDYIALVEQNIKMNGFLAQNKMIKIVSDFEMPRQILSIDNGKIEQVLNNLIGNAIKYSFPESTIMVKVFTKDNQIVTQVIDQGLGIPEKEIEGIFNPFKRTSIRPTGGENSHGLGLAIVKRIIEGHNGDIGVASEIGKGSTFYFALGIT